jgi:FG-GAP repeat
VKKFIGFACLPLLVLNCNVFPLAAQAQFTQQGQKLVGSDTAPQARQGIVSLSADGNTAIVGGWFDNNGAGAAWVYTLSGGVWTQQGPKLVGNDVAGAFVEQGFSVSLSGDGNTAIVGAPYDNDYAGAARVYMRSGGVWSQLGAKLVGAGAVGSAGQGYLVSLSGNGNTAIVGGPFDNNEVGAAWVYTRPQPVFAGTPGKANCDGQSVSALAKKYGGLNNAAAALDFPSVSALQNAIEVYCEG